MTDEDKLKPGRLFIGPAGSELMGIGSSGVPVIADASGVGEMREVRGLEELRFGEGTT